MKKIFAILLAVLCFASFFINDAYAKKRTKTIRKNSQVTLNKEDSCLYDLFNINLFWEKVRKNGKLIIDTSDEEFISIDYKYNFMGKDNSVVSLFGADSFKMYKVMIPIDNYRDGITTLSKLEKVLSERYTKVYNEKKHKNKYIKSSIFEVDKEKSSFIICSFEKNDNDDCYEDYKVCYSLFIHTDK